MRLFILLTVFICFFMAGCSLLDKIAPPQYDEAGNPIPGSRQPTDIVQTVAGTIPYGGTVLNVILLLAAGYEKYRSYKLEKGLKATLLAGKQVAADPQMAELWDKVKDTYYREAHETAGVTSLIKGLIAKLPMITKKV